MTIDEFIITMEDWCKKTNNTYDFKIGKDLEVNTRLTIDGDGFIWIRAYESFKRVKTTVNVNNVVEFRKCDYYDNCFFIICPDYTGFSVQDEEIYYCIDGQPSGFGSAVEHFERFPDGVVRKDS